MPLYGPLLLRRVTAVLGGASLTLLALACGPGSGASGERQGDRRVPTSGPIRIQLIEQDGRRLTVRLANKSGESVSYSPSYYLLQRRTEDGTVLINPFRTASPEAPSAYTLNSLSLRPNGQSRHRLVVPSSLPRGRYLLLYPFSDIRGTEPLARLPFELG